MIWFALPDVHIMIVIDFLLCIALDGIAGRDAAKSTKRVVGTLWSENKKKPMRCAWAKKVLCYSASIAPTGH